MRANQELDLVSHPVKYNEVNLRDSREEKNLWLEGYLLRLTLSTLL